MHTSYLALCTEGVCTLHSYVNWRSIDVLVFASLGDHHMVGNIYMFRRQT